MERLELLARLAQPADSRLVLLVLDGVGDLRTADQPATALQRAETPNLDALAARSALGRILPAGQGITPGSGPGHLALFGYDPTSEEADIGRGVLEALGSGVPMGPGDVAARGNFATRGPDGTLTDRRAGRIPTAECERLVDKLNRALAETPVDGVEASLTAGEGYRFVLRLRGAGLSPEVADTDPQKTGLAPLRARAKDPAAEATAEAAERVLAVLRPAIADEPQANELLLRGFSSLPALPQMGEVYKMRCGAFAGYPLYRGVASACGMDVIPCGQKFSEIVETVAEHWDRYDFFFLHVKQTDAAGEDGNLDAKVAVLESVDRHLPRLLELGPDVVAVTGDHSTPAPMRAHSWHPVPLLLHGRNCFIDEAERYDEVAAIRGHLGTLASRDLLSLMLANGGRLKKFGA